VKFGPQMAKNSTAVSTNLQPGPGGNQTETGHQTVQTGHAF